MVQKKSFVPFQYFKNFLKTFSSKEFSFGDDQKSQLIENNKKCITAMKYSYSGYHILFISLSLSLYIYIYIYIYNQRYELKRRTIDMYMYKMNK